MLHFVNRNPGLRVADLLEILKITKQSLARVLKQLVDEGWIVQKAGERDRRQRLLHATDKGAALARRLDALQAQARRAGAGRGGRRGNEAVVAPLPVRHDQPRRSARWWRRCCREPVEAAAAPDRAKGVEPLSSREDGHGTAARQRRRTSWSSTTTSASATCWRATCSRTAFA